MGARCVISPSAAGFRTTDLRNDSFVIAMPATSGSQLCTPSPVGHPISAAEVEKTK
ncbi:hypothetical protein HYDPIDRAFT_115260 [Hydnomerulius pinastri MD-312]|uniref:Uncharacterized protein n=1 Tax=Hydnomerulius pinastri MD-312 TaxID=994086 RepID=A0A0C9WC63_9AGAM|nr:hypothetical protein HYDPIDRAFT_115260 [Hydnomerulius pinastri MD-312]